MDPQRLQQLPPGPTSSGANRRHAPCFQAAGMMTVDPAVLGGAVVGLVTLQLTSLGIVERTYEPHRFTVGMPGKPPAAAHVAPDAPDAGTAAVGSP